MKRYRALLRDTWWVWAIMIGGGLTAAICLNPVFLVIIPICLFSFFYFGTMRYDDDGNETGGNF